MTRRVLAVDPGKMTGWAFVDIDSPVTFVADEADHMSFLSMAERVIERDRVDAIVCESYVINARSIKVTRGENWSLEQIGVLRWLCAKRDIEFSEQTAADAKRFGTDTKLKELGWFTRTVGGHRNDACRHLVTYIARAGAYEDMVRYAREVRRGTR